MLDAPRTTKAIETPRRTIDVHTPRWLWWHDAPRPFVVAAFVTAALGFFVRAYRTFATDFPLNDGGLFLVMTRDLQRSHYLLPVTTTYNGAGIPFAYSPFGFYVAGLLNDITRIPLLDVFRLLTLFVTTAVVVALFALAREMLASRVAIIAATVAFALIPRSFVWLLMGGGLTRSFGYLFALLAIRQVYLLYTRRELRLVPLAALFSALTFMSHLETGKWLAISIAVFFLCYGRHWRGVMHSALLAVGTLVLSAPWWGTVIAYHGLAPFLAASGTDVSVFTGKAERTEIWNALKVFGIATNEPYFWLIGSIALLGVLTTTVSALAATNRRNVVLPVLPIWWLAAVVLDNRAAATYTTAPIALLAGIALADVILPALTRAFASSSLEWHETMTPSLRQTLSATTSSIPNNATDTGATYRAVAADRGGERGAWRPSGTKASWRLVAREWPVILVVGAMLGYAVLGALTPRHDVSGDLPSLVSLSPDERAAMIWAGENTPVGSTFFVASGGNAWPTDRIVEWFPALSGRISVNTPQGYEWTPNKGFLGRIFRYNFGVSCAWSDGYCLDRWSIGTGATFEYVFVRADHESDTRCCLLADYLLTDSRYTLIFHNDGAAIYARR